MTDREVMKMALEAFKISAPVFSPRVFTQAFKALEEALAQPEQKPVAWRKKANGVWHYFDESTPFPFDDCEPLYETVRPIQS